MQPATGKKIISNKIISDIRQRQVEFQLTRENEKLLRDEGATDDIIEAIRQNSPRLPISKQLPTVKSKELKNSIGMEFVRIPSGSFEMGSNDGADDEKPAHRVTIRNSFYMGKYEVTQEEYEEVMGTTPSNITNCPRCPVEQVSWDDAQDFIRKLNAKNEGTYRLPTEAEWEYAARAGTTTKWCFGNDENQLVVYGWYSKNSGNRSHEVGMKEPNDFGIYDMHGNVHEWTQDWFGNYQSGSVTDPKGPSEGSRRVFRGGSWFGAALYLRSAARDSFSPSTRHIHIGFRVLRQ